MISDAQSLLASLPFADVWRWSMLIVGGILALGLVGVVLGVWLDAGKTCVKCGDEIADHSGGVCPSRDPW